ncbi:hypothetical protein [Thermococcus peptonophilus]|uniref:hypothetical protein n=1 Tax=Thermococcus peptonophilus TaxID=53952 RepID=UPI000AFC1026
MLGGGAHYEQGAHHHAVITIALVVYAFETAQLPPASIEYTEVFYVDNQSVTFITQDGFGLFTMKISPHVDNFELKIEFPEGTTYLVRYGSEQFKGGETTFKINVHKGGTLRRKFTFTSSCRRS